MPTTAVCKDWATWYLKILKETEQRIYKLLQVTNRRPQA